MRAFDIVLGAFILAFLIQYITWGVRVTRYLSALQRDIDALAAGQTPEREFPPRSISFP